MANALTVKNDNIDRYVAEINRHPLLSREDELSLAQQFFDAGDVQAAHKLVVSNLRFVVKIAHEYRGYGLKLLDLIQEGNVGLMVAVKKFDPYRGYRLISYAVWWIRAHIQSFIMRSWSLVRLGAGRVSRKLFFKLRSARSRATQDAGADVSDRDMAELLGVHEADIAAMDGRLAIRDFSLDARLSDDGGMTHLDMMADPQSDSQEEVLSKAQQEHQLRGQVARAMGTLNDKERYIVDHRLLSEEPRTLQEIGDEFKVSRERVRQLESRVIAKLRRAFATSSETQQQVASV